MIQKENKVLKKQVSIYRFGCWFWKAVINRKKTNKKRRMKQIKKKLMRTIINNTTFCINSSSSLLTLTYLSQKRHDLIWLLRRLIELWLDRLLVDVSLWKSTHHSKHRCHLWFPTIDSLFPTRLQNQSSRKLHRCGHSL